jgi:2-amino-4-hydroxy-6-hydroxymethyldihydropteridine diphosphokinase
MFSERNSSAGTRGAPLAGRAVRVRAGISLGSNLGDRFGWLTNARTKIFVLPGVLPPFLSSSIYETEPIDCEPAAPKFLNAVIEIEHESPPAELLHQLQQIEVELGRPLGHERNRSRTIDLDLLYHGVHVIAEPQLQLPHPRLRFRGFVLQPLAEIRPDLVLPGETKTVADLARELASQSPVVRAATQW